MDELKLTSVKVLKSLYNKFKVKTINTKISLQKITNRSVYLYLNDNSFRDKINKLDNLQISGSNL